MLETPMLAPCARESQKTANGTKTNAKQANRE